MIKWWVSGYHVTVPWSLGGARPLCWVSEYLSLLLSLTVQYFVAPKDTTWFPVFVQVLVTEERRVTNTRNESSRKICFHQRVWTAPDSSCIYLHVQKRKFSFSAIFFFFFLLHFVNGQKCTHCKMDRGRYAPQSAGIIAATRDTSAKCELPRSALDVADLLAAAAKAPQENMNLPLSHLLEMHWFLKLLFF